MTALEDALQIARESIETPDVEGWRTVNSARDELKKLQELEQDLKQAYALGIYKGTDGLLRNSWQQRVEELEREVQHLKTEREQSERNHRR